MMQKTKPEKRLTKAAKLKLITGSGGLLSTIAEIAGVDRATVQRWHDSDRNIASAIAAELAAERSKITAIAQSVVVK